MRNTFGLSGHIPTDSGVMPDVSPDPRLARIRRHVQTRPRPYRGPPEAPLYRRRQVSGNAASGLPPRQCRSFGRAGLCRPRAQGAGQGRHHLPHLLHDQADHLGGLHDAGRGRPRHPRRAGPQIHPGMEKPRRVPGRHGACVSDQAAGAADADRRLDAPYLRADLRLPAARQCRRRLSQGKIGEVEKSGTLDR